MKRQLVRMLALVLSAAAVLPQAAMAEAPIVKLETAKSTAGGLSRVFFGHVVARETVDLAFQVSGRSHTWFQRCSAHTVFVEQIQIENPAQINFSSTSSD